MIRRFAGFGLSCVLAILVSRIFGEGLELSEKTQMTRG
jgi:hypothetical protein